MNFIESADDRQILIIAQMSRKQSESWYEFWKD